MSQKKWYKRKRLWAGVAAAAGAIFDLTVPQQSLIAEILVTIGGVL